MKTFIHTLLTCRIFFISLLVTQILWTDGPVNNYLIENNYVDLVPQDLPPGVSADSGWVRLYTGTTINFKSVFFINTLTGFIAGGCCIFKTTNSGMNWVVFCDSNIYCGFSSIFFPTSNIGYAARDVEIFKTTNSGLNWSKAYLQIDDCRSLFFLNPDTGFVTGNQEQFAQIGRTTNGGINWLFQWLPSLSPGEVFFSSPNTGYAACSQTICKTTNNGNNWICDFGPATSYRGLHFLNDNTGYVSTLQFGQFGGNLFKTTNSGTNWQQLNSNTTKRLYDVYFVNNNTGWCVGDSGVIIRTTNAGETWHQQISVTTTGWYRQIFFTSPVTGYIVGDGGIVLKTTTGGEPIGIEPVSSTVPESYKLYQNYPNPFNPSTKIKFEIPHSLNAKVEVYDVLGKLVDVILNRRLAAGVYEIPWDGTSFASGVYYLRLSAGNFSDVKKMVLLK